MNKLFVVNKPINISSNFYLKKIKRLYKTKKAGFSGTLDPFACGCLIVAFGQYTKLFQYLSKTPKSYRATIWLGAYSQSLDNENIILKDPNPKSIDILKFKQELKNIVGELEYLPPKYSAKKIDGQRAYNLAREGIEFKTNKISTAIHNTNFISYSHPFITFDISVSEGGYIRSIAQILLNRISNIGTLSYLERLNEGQFKYNNQISLNPLDYINLPKLKYKGTKEWIKLGKKITFEYIDNRENGIYLLPFDDFFSIIEIKQDKISYLLNKVML